MGPSVFQRALNFILKTFIKLKICLVYIDDIVIFSRTFKEHIGHLAEVLKCLKEAGLKVKISKCQFAQNSVKFLGHIISAEGVRPNPEKVKSIEDFPSPKNADEVKVVLGMFGYYRKYIKNYGGVAHPMVKLLKKGTEFEWKSEQEAFQTLKKRLLEPPILGYPCFTLPFIVDTDASSFGAGAVLCQKQDSNRPEHEKET